jgi:hypothetical protein
MDCVITDTLLQGLVYKSGTTELIPRLEFLALTSLLGFTDALYIAVVASRVERHADAHIDKSCIFETHLWWHAARKRNVTSEILDNVAGGNRKTGWSSVPVPCPSPTEMSWMPSKEEVKRRPILIWISNTPDQNSKCCKIRLNNKHYIAKLACILFCDSSSIGVLPISVN